MLVALSVGASLLRADTDEAASPFGRYLAWNGVAFMDVTELAYFLVFPGVNDSFDAFVPQCRSPGSCTNHLVRHGASRTRTPPDRRMLTDRVVAYELLAASQKI
ncbi:hypothetical protein DQP55_23200, partial [Mycolicibacterium sp. GF69]